MPNAAASIARRAYTPRENPYVLVPSRGRGRQRGVRAPTPGAASARAPTPGPPSVRSPTPGPPSVCAPGPPSVCAPGPPSVCAPPPDAASVCAPPVRVASAGGTAAAQFAANQLLGDAQRNRCARADTKLHDWTDALFASHQPVHHVHHSCYDVQYSLMHTITTQCRELVSTAYDYSVGDRRHESHNKFKRDIGTLRVISQAFCALRPTMAMDDTGIEFHSVTGHLLCALDSMMEPIDITKHDNALRRLILEF